MGKLIAFVLCCSLTSTVASAGFLAEPYLGYTSGSVTSNSLSNEKIKNTISAPTVGVLLGWSMGSWYTGIDARHATGTSESDETPASKYDSTVTTISLQAGALMGPWKVYLAYGFSDQVELKETGSTYKYKDGSTMALGFGRRFGPVDVSLEYLSRTFKNYDYGVSSGAVSDITTKIEGTDYFLLVGIPLGMGK